jgi:hypothetical protein
MTGEVAIVGYESDLGRYDFTGRRVWYLGSDYARYLELEEAAPQNLVRSGEAINDIAARISRDIIDLDARLASGRFWMTWLASDIAERNPYNSPFFLDVCRAIALVEAARKGGRHTVVVDDASFGGALAALCRDNGLVARVRDLRPRRNLLLRALRSHAGFMLGWLRQWRALRRSPGDLAGLSGRRVWMMSWADGENRGEVDRFLGKLPLWLRQSGSEVGFLYNPIAWMRSIDSIAAAVAHQGSAVLAGQFFGFCGLVQCYLSLLAFPLTLRRRFVLQGVDLTRLMWLSVRRELASSRLPAAALFQYLAPHLKRLGVCPQTLFYVWENQPWEKTMLAGFRRALPSTTLIGIQHAPFAERFLSGHPSARQWRDGTTPDLLLTAGPGFRARLIALGAPPSRIIVGGTLRYCDLCSPVFRSTNAVSNKARLVLAACSMDPRDSLELAYKAILATASLPDVRLAINFHPLIEAPARASMRARLVRLADCQHVDFVEGGAMQWLNRADILLYNSSSTAFEAASLGIPVVFVASDLLLDVDVMSGAGTPEGRHPDELRRQIIELLDSADKRERTVAAAKSHLQNCLSASAPDVWTALVGSAVAEARC